MQVSLLEQEMLWGTIKFFNNLSHPFISIHILQILIFTFPWILTRRIYLTIKASLVGDHYLYSHDIMNDSAVYL